MEFCSVCVCGGWQTALIEPGTGRRILFGPVFNDCTGLWVWQSVNLARV